MVSGCCDGTFIKRCVEFLLSCPVRDFQWTDNSAARQLVARQGMGRIRHLSGQILWIQDTVLCDIGNMNFFSRWRRRQQIGTRGHAPLRPMISSGWWLI